MIDDILHRAPALPGRLNPDIPPKLEDIILKCLEKDPENRYQSAKEVGVDLRRLATPTTAMAPAARPRRPYSILAASIGVAMLMALLVGSNIGGWRERLLGRAAAPKILSLAVLPLDNLSKDAEQEYFADGMTDQLTTELAQLGALRVISRTSVMQYKHTKKTLPEIARELHVDGVVEGSVALSGDRVRVTAQLIQAPTDQHLWAASYERDLRDVLALQDEVARTIAHEIGLKISSQVEQRLARPRAVNPEAYEAYLRGNSYLDKGDLQKSLDYFNQAIKLDANYAPPYAKSATAYYFLAFFNLLAPNQAFPKMKDAAMKAMERDDSLPEGHGALALVKLHYEWDFPGAEREFKRALELNPNDADIRHDYAHYLLAMGRVEESVVESDRAVTLDPVGTVLTACLCWHRYAARQYSESIAQALKAIQIEPGFDWTHIVVGWDYEQQRKFNEAIDEFQEAIKLSGSTAGNPQPSEFSLAALGHAFAMAGNTQHTEKVLARLKEIGQHGYVSAFDLAVIYVAMGDKEKAFQWLQKAFEERATFLVYMKWEPRLDPLRSDPRFQHLLRRIGLPP